MKSVLLFVMLLCGFQSFAQTTSPTQVKTALQLKKTMEIFG